MRRHALLLALTAAVLVCPARAAQTRRGFEAGPTTAPDAARPATRPAGSEEDKARELAKLIRKARKVSRINRRLMALFEADRYAEAEAPLKEILRIDPSNRIAWYNLACVHSRLGRKQEAVACLATAVRHGYSTFRHMQRDPDLEAIRRTAGYRKLLARRDEIHRERAEKIRRTLRDRFGPDYLYGIDHERKLVFATNVDSQTLEDMRRRLTEYGEAQWRDLFTHKFERYLTVVVPRSSDWKFGQGVGGFYSRPQHVLYARTVGMSLIHEFTHALHGADQEGMGQGHPIWVVEGLATLFESSKVVDGHATPQPNRRLNLLQRLVRRKMTVPFAEFVKYSHAQFMRKVLAAYPQCRYMMMYLHAKGVLKKWYDAYTADYERDPSGAAAMEKVLGKDLPAIEADWKRWVLARKPPVLRLPPKHAYLGIQLAGAVDGVRVMRVVPGSGAEKAGLEAGDVIVALDGQRVIDPGRLLGMIYAHEVGQQVRVRFRRDGRYRTAAVTLGAMPEDPSRPRARRRRRPRPPARRPKPATQPAGRPAKKKAA
jgi:hypothetical protein